MQTLADASEYEDMVEIEQLKKRAHDAEQRRYLAQLEAEAILHARQDRNDQIRKKIEHDHQASHNRLERSVSDALALLTDSKKRKQIADKLAKKEEEDAQVELKAVERRLQKRQDDTYWVIKELERKERREAERHAREAAARKAEEEQQSRLAAEARKEQLRQDKLERDRQFARARVQFEGTETTARGTLAANQLTKWSRLLQEMNEQISAQQKKEVELREQELEVERVEQRLQLMAAKLELQMQFWDLQRNESQARDEIIDQFLCALADVRARVFAAYETIRLRFEDQLQRTSASELEARASLRQAEAREFLALRETEAHERESLKLELEIRYLTSKPYQRRRHSTPPISPNTTGDRMATFETRRRHSDFGEHPHTPAAEALLHDNDFVIPAGSPAIRGIVSTPHAPIINVTQLSVGTPSPKRPRSAPFDRRLLPVIEASLPAPRRDVVLEQPRLRRNTPSAS
eukprot:TRINITY_DN15566_c0_g1_i1.p1 TRINITY_DN15566_c0_g1~~TRINITY_DN15566_c0_g1_i1.p1  ORF type:complete len:527 (+),score=103.96 TRINITY_DN15566_c0_g1_i1:192-1583(+)